MEKLTIEIYFSERDNILTAKCKNPFDEVCECCDIPITSIEATWISKELAVKNLFYKMSK